ncbi:WXG100 family type VII secretion target [Actinoplanes sp. NPDC026619]|uniref:WXG100 family type VII secretion target n=1 Tax=Actinoplanes sp. NPDC026619 TaxID=3155798 RepID=UPI0033F5920E
MRIGGDIGGLQKASGLLSGVTEEMRGSAEALSKRVDQLIGDAGWSGAAAEEFKGAWEQDATAVVELSSCVQLAGRTLATLSADLEQAQRQLDLAVSDALDAGVPVGADGSVPPGVYTEPVLAAMRQYSAAAKAAEDAAQDARDTATEMLHEITAAIAGEPTSFLKSADVAILAASLKGYYALPNEYAADAKTKLDDFNRQYKDTRYARKHSPAGSNAKAALTGELAEMRAVRKGLVTDLSAAEKVAGHFKGGRFLGSSLGDLADGMGVLQDGGKLSRLLDGVPAVDVVLGAFATWAQAKEDHEKGWGWTHAILVDGGSNAAAIGAGVATDFIPYVGPVLAPFTSYGVGAFGYEAGHEGHWTEHISEDGVLKGIGEGLVDTGKTTWDEDVVGMYHKVGHDIEHPQEAAKSLWHGVKNLF